MKLTEISGRRGPIAFVGQEIEPVAVVTGPNACGKTTLLELIAFGIGGIGRERLGQQPRSVTLRFDALRIDRMVELDQEGQTVHNVEVGGPGVHTTKVREAEAAVARFVGPAWAWDARALFNSTPPERRKVLAAIVGARLTVTAARQALQQHEAGFQAVPEDAQKHVRAAAKRLTELKEHEGADFCTGWLAALRSAKNASQADVDAARQAVRTAEVRAEAAGAVPGSSDAYRLQLEGLRAREAELLTQQGAFQARADSRASLIRAYAEAERLYKSTRALVEGDSVARAEAAVDAAIAERLAWSHRASEFEASHTAAAQVVADLAGRVAAAREAERVAREAHGAARQRAGHRDAVHQIMHLVEPLLAFFEQYAEVDDGSDLGRAVIELRKLSGPDPVADLEGLEAAVRAETGRVDAAIRMHDRACIEREATRRRLEQWRGQPDPVPGLKTVAESARVAVQEAAARLEEQGATLSRLSEELASAAAGVDVLLPLAELRSEIGEVEKVLAKIADHDAIMADRDRCVVRSREMAAARQELHEVEKRAERVVGELYRDAVAPLVGPASHVTRAVFGEDLALLPVDGWQIALGRTPVEHCSESQAIVCGVALHAAVASLSQGWRGVLLDGVEAIDQTRRGDLLLSLQELQQDGKVDNVLIAMVEDGFTVPGSVQRIRRG